MEAEHVREWGVETEREIERRDREGETETEEEKQKLFLVPQADTYLL